MTNKILDRLVALMPNSIDVHVPPNCFMDMQGEFVHFDVESKQLTARFPVLNRYQNPLFMMQGGLIVAAIDNAIRPLSWLVAPPSVTAQMNTSYIRPVTRDDDYIFVEGAVNEITRRQLFLFARAINPTGKLVAVDHATCAVIEGDK